MIGFGFAAVRFMLALCAAVLLWAPWARVATYR